MDMLRKNMHYATLITVALLLLSAGCSSMLPKSKNSVESPWDTFEQVKASFDKIIPFQTTNDELSELNFTPDKTPNMKILSYLDVISRFMPTPSISKEDIDEGLLNCIKAQSICQAYELSLQKIHNERYGNLFLDMFRFKQTNRKTGWNFKALIVLNDNTVIYKIWSGQPRIDEDTYQKTPLGPFQEPAGFAKDATIITTF
jgi:hypothetical protein